MEIQKCHIWVAVVDSSLGWLLILSQPLQPSSGNSRVPHLGRSYGLILGLIIHSSIIFATQQWSGFYCLPFLFSFFPLLFQPSWKDGCQLT